MTQVVPPSLFGLQQSNRNFAKPDSWGKNQFNSSFPAALACWMGTHGINPIYLRLNQSSQVYHDEIRVESLFGLAVHDPNLHFHFEDAFTPYSDLIVGKFPRADLVTRHAGTAGKDALSAIARFANVISPDLLECVRDDPPHRRRIISTRIRILACS